MLYELKIKKLGEFYEILAIKAKSGNSSGFKFNIKSEKSLHNLIRAKNTIQDIVLSNNFKYFFTLTFSPDFDRFNLHQIYKSFKNVIRYIHESLKLKLDYIIVPEQHKNGAWHLHGFFNDSIEQLFYINKNGYTSLKYFDALGYQNIQQIKDIRRASSYVTKYVAKNLGKGIDYNRHSYFCSKSLSRGLDIYSKLYNNETFNSKFFEFRNDYCCKRILTGDEFERYRSLFRLL